MRRELLWIKREACMSPGIESKKRMEHRLRPVLCCVIGRDWDR